MRAVVDEDKCLGNGLCESVASAIFAVDEDSLAHVLLDPVPTHHRAELTQAVRMCPTQAIAMED